MSLLLCSNGSSDKEPSPVDSFAVTSAAECANTRCTAGVNLKVGLTRVRDVSLHSCSKQSALIFLLEEIARYITE